MGIYILIFTICLPIFLSVCYSIFYVCDNCIKSCVIFTENPVTQCAENCEFCGYFDNRFNNWLNWWHTDDFSYLKSDESVCKNNYSPTPKLESKLKNNTKDKPNIVLIVLDDLDEVISPYWEAMPFAKELFKLNGTHFSNGYTSTSFCCPARCQIFTGMYGHNNGVISSYGRYGSVNAFRKPYYLNGTRMKDKDGKCINNEYRSLHTYLQKYGKYKTGIFGKYLNGFESDTYSTIEYVPPGWDQFDITTNNYQYVGHMYVMTQWDSQNKTVKYKYYGRDSKNYLTDVIKDKAINFITKHSNKNNKQNKQDSPLFMYIAPTAPHFPQVGAHRHLHMIKYWEQQFEKYVKSRLNFHSNESVNTKSSWLKTNSKVRDKLLNVDINNWYEKRTLNIHKLEFAKRMTTLYAVDEMIKSIYLELQKRDKLNNTLFAFVSDNGFNMGSHKLYHKMAPYEESIKVPFYLSGLNFKKGYTDERLTLLNDIAPTILNLAGFKIPDHMDGIDLSTKLSRSGILIEYGKHAVDNDEDYTGTLHRVSEFKMAAKLTPHYMGFDVPPYTAIRTHNFTYIEYYNLTHENLTEFELYDMKNDPNQIFNIYENLSKHNKSMVDNLRTYLKRLETCYGTQCIF